MDSMAIVGACGVPVTGAQNSTVLNVFISWAVFSRIRVRDMCNAVKQIVVWFHRATWRAFKASFSCTQIAAKPNAWRGSLHATPDRSLRTHDVPLWEHDAGSWSMMTDCWQAWTTDEEIQSFLVKVASWWVAARVWLPRWIVEWMELTSRWIVE
jgi:hypothetical protein